MKAKTIEKIINAKFKKFVKTIDDKHVRELVKDNTIVTGGCITSMLLDEPVNDFDLYFTDFETTQAVAEYYVKKMKKSTKFRGDVEVKVTDNLQVEIYIQSRGYMGKLPSDEDRESEPDFIVMDDKNNKFDPVFASSNAISLNGDIQLIVRFYGTPEEIHDNYDFTHCKNYWTSSEKKVVLDKDALECILTKELKYTGSKYPLCSIFRTRKFIQRGWTINAGQYLKMAMQLNDLDLKDVNVLKDQLTGVDSTYFLCMISKLEDIKDPTTDYVINLVDEIF